VLPQTNARLTKVAGGGTSEDYDVPEGADDAKWEGDADAYYQEKRERVSAGGDTDLVLRRALIVETDLGIDFEEGDTVAFTLSVGDRTGKVQVIERRELAGMGPLATTRLTLEVA
jgi:hypothetical protein